MLNKSNCKANPAPEKDEEEQDGSEDEGEEDGEEKPGVAESQKVFKEVRRPVDLLENQHIQRFQHESRRQKAPEGSSLIRWGQWRRF